VNHPRVAVIIPTHNSARTLAQAIDSALGQRFDSFETIIINDASTDATESVLAEYTNQIRVINLPRQSGFKAARNVGVNATDAEYIGLLDADDIWLPDKLAHSVCAIERTPGAVLALSDFISIDQDGRTLASSGTLPRFARSPSLDDLLEQWWSMVPSTLVMKRCAYEPCEDFLAMAGGNLVATGFVDDYMFLRTHELGEFVYVPEPLIMLRQTPLLDWLDKWDGQVFVKAVRKRYGKRAQGLLADTRDFFAKTLARKAWGELQRGEIKKSLRTTMRILYYRPLYPALMLPKALRRLSR
jgi:glycosyltransferase involved in cell wall biosynthesis